MLVLGLELQQTSLVQKRGGASGGITKKAGTRSRQVLALISGCRQDYIYFLSFKKIYIVMFILLPRRNIEVSLMATHSRKTSMFMSAALKVELGLSFT